MDRYKYKLVDDQGGSFSIPKKSGFYLKYEKGTRVKAPEGSLGIMVFSNCEIAKRFLHRGGYSDQVDIKRVIPIGEKTVPEWISKWTTTDEGIRRFNKISPSNRALGIDCGPPPQGTECYPEVIVID